MNCKIIFLTTLISGYGLAADTAGSKKFVSNYSNYEVTLPEGWSASIDNFEDDGSRPEDVSSVSFSSKACEPLKKCGVLIVGRSSKSSPLNITELHKEIENKKKRYSDRDYYVRGKLLNKEYDIFVAGSLKKNNAGTYSMSVYKHCDATGDFLEITARSRYQGDFKTFFKSPENISKSLRPDQIEIINSFRCTDKPFKLMPK